MKRACRHLRMASMAFCTGALFLTGGCGSHLLEDSENFRDSENVFHLAEAARMSGDLEAAARMYKQSMMVMGEKIEPLIGLGETFLDAGAGDEALDSFNQALVLDNNNDRALLGKIKTYLVLNRPQEAIRTADMAYKLFGNRADLLNVYGMALDMSGEHGKAQKLYRQAIKLAPKNLSLQNNLSLSLALSGQYTEAIDTLKKLARGADSTPKVRQNLAVVYALAGQTEEAEHLFRMDLGPAETNNNLAYLDLIRGLDKDALRAQAIPVSVDEENRQPLFSQLSSQTQLQTLRAQPPRPAGGSIMMPQQPMPAPFPASSGQNISSSTDRGQMGSNGGQPAPSRGDDGARGPIKVTPGDPGSGVVVNISAERPRVITSPPLEDTSRMEAMRFMDDQARGFSQSSEETRFIQR